MSEPNWADVHEVVSVTVQEKNQVVASRTYACREADQDDADEPRTYTEIMWPAYVPEPPAAVGVRKDADLPSGGTGAVTTADAYWSKAAEQARGTAKWIATALGAALAVVVGTAPLNPLGGDDVDWWSWQGAAVVAGVVLLGVTLFMVVSVLVPGITSFADLMRTAGGADSFPGRLSVPASLGSLSRKAAAGHGVLLPIGVASLDELGHRVRLEELTLNSVAEALAEADPGAEGAADRTFWTEVKRGRGQILQGYLDEVAQWVVVASYVGVKVRADRARSIGLAAGLLGAMALVWGYIAIQPTTAAPTATVSTYVVLDPAAASPVRQVLGPECDAFTGVALRGAPAGKLAVYVIEGAGCRTGSVVLPSGGVVTVARSSATPSPSVTPSPSASASPTGPLVPSPAPTGATTPAG